MTFISRFGPLEISLVSLFLALFLYRIQAAAESRIATALMFICTSRFGASFINGFSISEATKLSFGQLDTVFAYLMLAFAFLEVLLIRKVAKWKAADLWVLVSILGLGFLNLTWNLAFAVGLSANDFIYVIVILLFLAIHPTREDLKFLPYFGAIIILLVLVVALLKYQNPLFPYRKVDYGLGSPYQNRVWDFFGWEERFRGPYFHPNQLGIQITFLSMLVLLKPTKLYIGIIPISYILLFLASSRTSIFALTVGLFFRIYFELTQVKAVDVKQMEKTKSPNTILAKSRARRLLIAIIFLTLAVVVAQRIIGVNTSGTGRLQNYGKTISMIQENWLLGNGPSLFSINSTENTVLTILSYYGILGFILILGIALAFAYKFRKTISSSKRNFLVVLSIFLVASSGETLLTGSSVDTGLFYLLVLLTLTRVNEKKLP
jgi:hypothetical protein